MIQYAKFHEFLEAETPTCTEAPTSFAEFTKLPKEDWGDGFEITFLVIKAVSVALHRPLINIGQCFDEVDGGEIILRQHGSSKLVSIEFGLGENTFGVIHELDKRLATIVDGDLVWHVQEDKPRPQELAKTVPLPSVACVIVNNQGQVLIAQRAPTHYYMPGAWQFPGGRLEHGENLAVAARREAREETGIPDDELDYLGVCHIDSSVNSDGGHWVCIFVAFRYTGKTLPPNPEPAKHADWIWHSTIEDMPQPAMPGEAVAICGFLRCEFIME